MRIFQKVELRDKVRQRKVRNSLRAAFKTLKICAALFLMAFATLRIYDFLFRDDFFLIKSVMLNEQNDLSARIKTDLQPLLGRSLLFISTRKAELGLMERYPEISKVSLRRALPDRIRVSVSLRAPQALIRAPKNFKGIDREGKVFPLPKGFSRSNEVLPELVLKSGSAPGAPLGFLESWNKAVLKLDSPESWRLSKVTVDEYGELSAEVSAGAEHASPRTLNWGVPAPENFDEKFEHLVRVSKDLTAKNLRAKTVDLAGAPERVLVSIKKGNE